jgi:hypothetical protein
MLRSPLSLRPRRAWRAGWRAFRLLAAALVVLGGVLLHGCASAQPPFRLQVEEGDRQREWGLLYYQSWQKERSRTFLLLARQRTQDAIRIYLDVQRRMGYAYPDFYTVDRRRMASCLFLTQLQREATGFGVQIDDPRRVGCFD